MYKFSDNWPVETSLTSFKGNSLLWLILLFKICVKHSFLVVLLCSIWNKTYCSSWHIEVMLTMVFAITESSDLPPAAGTSNGVPPLILWIIIACVGGFTIVAIIVVTAIVCHRRQMATKYQDKRKYVIGRYIKVCFWCRN